MRHTGVCPISRAQRGTSEHVSIRFNFRSTQSIGVRDRSAVAYSRTVLSEYDAPV